MRIAVAAIVSLLLAGCSSTVAGSASQGIDIPATVTTTTTTVTTARPATTARAVPTSIDPAADQQYCEQTITGALGKPMEVVVVETPAGRVDCDQAGAVLVDYYAKRPDPKPGSDALEVAGFSCNQVSEPDIPQVICTDGDSLIFSMWRQGG
ncbi:PBP1b-binding outer membrane lipoprotein LpoB [Kibdelosporangium banguiense]|uniref:PBP1b-binding outer membrane lipoprotein LpoB n=1 Tax=Kibdelosporangium banguiense TaxID=1365924 RepID=A0ABS4T942_9PSEU|nr:hypothetical protein [Kibdelosporangium banguiense]MBP2320363.1 PBP1b-binding outer membrane lipoprotein LpoB [Kibdelosporangium banguiense]